MSENIKMKISVVTVTYNCVANIEASLESIKKQSLDEKEHIVIDGGSNDGTLEILQKYSHQIDVLASEPDNGIYDALNKGFKRVSGDIVGILHAGDEYWDSRVLENVARIFRNQAPDYVYGDVIMKGEGKRLSRYWKTGNLPNGKITGRQIPHPTLFLSQGLIQRLDPPFDPTYEIAADLKQQLLFSNILGARGIYLPEPLIKMELGGKSTRDFSAYRSGWSESRRAWNDVHGSGGFWYVVKKVISKISGIRV